jgi:hypothetical protein
MKETRRENKRRGKGEDKKDSRSRKRKGLEVREERVFLHGFNLEVAIFLE